MSCAAAPGWESSVLELGKPQSQSFTRRRLADDALKDPLIAVEKLAPTILTAANHCPNNTEVLRLQSNKCPRMYTEGSDTAVSKVVTGMQGLCALTSFDTELEPAITTESRVGGLLWALSSLRTMKSTGPPPAFPDAAKKRPG